MSSQSSAARPIRIGSCSMPGDIDSRNSSGTDTTKDAPGANYNASGLAGTIEAARILTRHRFAKTIIYAARRRTSEQQEQYPYCCVDDRLGEAMAREDPCGFDGPGQATGVVVGAGGVLVVSVPLLLRESMSPDISTTRSGWVVPRWIAMTFTTSTSGVARAPVPLPFTCCACSARSGSRHTLRRSCGIRRRAIAWRRRCRASRRACRSRCCGCRRQPGGGHTASTRAGDGARAIESRRGSKAGGMPCAESNGAVSGASRTVASNRGRRMSGVRRVRKRPRS